MGGDRQIVQRDSQTHKCGRSGTKQKKRLLLTRGNEFLVGSGFVVFLQKTKIISDFWFGCEKKGKDSALNELILP